MSLKGHVSEYTNGNTGLSSELTAWHKLLSMYKELAAQLGLTPYVREKFKFEQPKSTKNPFAKPAAKTLKKVG